MSGVVAEYIIKNNYVAFGVSISYTETILMRLLPKELRVALLVKYANDGMGYIPVCELDKLLTTGKVEAFKRSSGEWVNPKVDPVRGQGMPNTYTGPNRRARWQ